MYIKRIHINSFGCISDKEYNFDNGFNLIYGPNESGKSTLFAFIIFMFYGTKIKKRPGYMSFKEKYMPWDGKPMQGQIVFSHLGEDFILHRLYTPSRSEVTLKSLTNGEDIKDRKIIDNIGTHFFGVVAQSLYNSAYISGNDFYKDFDSSEELITKLTNTAEEHYTEVSYNEILDKINDEILELTSTKRRNAKIPNLQFRIDNKKRELANVVARMGNAEEVFLNRNKLYDTVEEKKKEIQFLKSRNSVLTAEQSNNSAKSLFVFCSWGITVILMAIFAILKIKTVFWILLPLGIISALLTLRLLAARRSEQNNNQTKVFTLQQNNDKIILLTQEMLECENLIRETERSRKELDDISTEKQSLSVEISLLTEELNKYKKRVEALELAMLCLKNSFKEFKSVFSPRLSELAGKIFSELTNSKYNSILVNDKLEMNIESDFGYKGVDFLSQGSYCQAYLALRLALCRIVLGDEHTPVFLDDILAYYDKDRLLSTMEYLATDITDTQILFTTCRENEMEFFKKKNVNIIQL